MTTESDIELMRRVAARDEAALRELIERHGDSLHRTARMLLGDAAADDAVQDTFIRLWTHARRYDRCHSVATWLRTICCRRCYDELRRRRRLSVMDEVDDEPSVQADDMQADELAALLRQAIATLPPKQQLVYQLREVEGLTAEETMSATGLDADKVKANLWAARAAIKEKLKRYGIQ